VDIYNKKSRWKYLIFISAIIIGIGSLFYTDKMVDELKNEERKNIELWAEATRQLAQPDLNDKDLGFLLQVIQNNKSVPVVLTNSKGEIISYRNLDSLKVKDEKYMRMMLKEMKATHDSIVVELGSNEKNTIYFRDSLILRKLFYYPYIQLTIIFLFIIIAYFAFSSSRKAEQNQVWVGLSKETAHQLGTPTSSLLAWVELLKGREGMKDTVTELEKDVKRLEVITDRFSKIGSKPILKMTNVKLVLNNSIDYLKTRASKRIHFILEDPEIPVYAPISVSLFEWVIENLFKNAVDAIENEGSITIRVKENAKNVTIDIIDTGKGIAKGKFKTIFKPGYTTKKRGWGLGLSLTKRIIHEYHNGKISVFSSEPEKGTTFRIMLRR
jgi:two-component system, sporulation sensor kinase D